MLTFISEKIETKYDNEEEKTIILLGVLMIRIIFLRDLREFSQPLQTKILYLSSFGLHCY